MKSGGLVSAPDCIPGYASRTFDTSWSACGEFFR